MGLVAREEPVEESPEGAPGANDKEEKDDDNVIGGEENIILGTGLRNVITLREVFDVFGGCGIG